MEKINSTYDIIAVKKEIRLLFLQIKSRNWIFTERKGDQRLGNTFEDLIDKLEDNLPIADFNGIEIKTQREKTTSMITLFSKSPSFPINANTMLRELFGIIREGECYKVLNTTISGHKFNNHRGGHSFKIDVDEKNEVLRIIVMDTKTKTIVSEDIYWDFSIIKKALESKLKDIALIIGEEKKENNKYFVKYNKLYFLYGITFSGFIQAIKIGDLLIDIRIGVYKTGEKIGKTHDHGTGFRIKMAKLVNYCFVEEIK